MPCHGGTGNLSHGGNLGLHDVRSTLRGQGHGSPAAALTAAVSRGSQGTAVRWRAYSNEGDAMGNSRRGILAAAGAGVMAAAIDVAGLRSPAGAATRSATGAAPDTALASAPLLGPRTTPITAFATSSDRIDVLAVASDGRIVSTYWSDAGVGPVVGSVFPGVSRRPGRRSRRSRVSAPIWTCSRWVRTTGSTARTGTNQPAGPAGSACPRRLFQVVRSASSTAFPTISTCSPPAANPATTGWWTHCGGTRPTAGCCPGLQ